MSLINKNNYEAFLLDYMEQNLSADMVAELMLFFEQNPELRHELEGLDDITLPTEKIVFDGKDELKKEVVENLMIAEIEGLNTSAESNELQEAIKEDQENEKAFLLYQKTILKPAAVVFENKESLKRERKIIPLYWWATSAAAILIAFFLVRNMNTEGVQKTQDNFADKKEVEVKTIKNAIDSSVNEQPIFIEEELLDNNTIQVAEEKKSTPLKVKEKKVIPIINNEPETGNNNLVAEEMPIIETDSITIMPTIYEDEVLNLRKELMDLAPQELVFDLSECNDVHLSVIQQMLAYKKLYSCTFKFASKVEVYQKVIEGFDTNSCPV